jgi:hypothetical protein
MEEKKIQKKDLREFGMVLSLILSLFAFIHFRKGHFDLSKWLSMFSGMSLLFAILVPAALMPAFKVFVKIAHALGWFNTRLILALVYYLIVTPIGIVLRVFGKDLLSLKLDKNKPSYWLDHHSGGVTKESLEKQF